jgi:MFS family permease
MRRSVTDGCFWSAMMGFGDQFLPAFILALNLGEAAAGLIATLPGFLGALISLATPWAVQKLGSHKKWVVFCAFVQAASFVPLVIAALVGAMPVWAAFAVIALYNFGGLAAGIGWSTWMSSIVPDQRRAAFFSFRNRMIWIVQLITIFVAGWVLEQFPQSKALLGFALILAIACAARTVSAALLARISEPVPLPNGHRVVGFGEVIRHTSRQPEGKMILYMLLVALATNVTLGFLPPFVLGALGEPKQHWALVMGAMMLGRIIILFFLGHQINRLGAKQVMMFGAVGITLIHAAFLVTRPASELLAPIAAHLPGPLANNPDLLYIMLIQVIAGVLYAMYDLSTWLLLLRHTREEERTSMIALTWFGFWVFSFAGTLVGQLVLSFYIIPGQSPRSFTYEGYMVLFAIGTTLRLLTLIPMAFWVGRLPKH